MFSTKTDLMIDECNNLENQVVGIKNQIYELENVVHILGMLSNLDGPVTQLNTNINHLKEEYTVLRQMMQGLHKSVLYYMNCENAICDNGEQSVIRYERQRIGLTDYSTISSLLDDFVLG